MKTDFFGTELNVGDTVAFIAPGYRHLVKGTIDRFTEKLVFINYMNNWNFGNPGRACELKQSAGQLIKYVDKE